MWRIPCAPSLLHVLARFLFLGPRRRSTAHSAFARAKVVDNRVGL